MTSTEATSWHPIPLTGTLATDSTRSALPPGASVTRAGAGPVSVAVRSSFGPAPAPEAPEAPKSVTPG